MAAYLHYSLRLYRSFAKRPLICGLSWHRDISGRHDSGCPVAIQRAACWGASGLNCVRGAIREDMRE
jgi:hypothetical protein